MGAEATVQSVQVVIYMEDPPSSGFRLHVFHHVLTATRPQLFISEAFSVDALRSPAHTHKHTTHGATSREVETAHNARKFHVKQKHVTIFFQTDAASLLT